MFRVLIFYILIAFNIKEVNADGCTSSNMTAKTCDRCAQVCDINSQNCEYCEWVDGCTDTFCPIVCQQVGRVWNKTTRNDDSSMMVCAKEFPGWGSTITCGCDLANKQTSIMKKNKAPSDDKIPPKS